MEQILCHLMGDYLLQTDYQATNKTKNNWAAISHCVSYTMCFLLLTNNFYHLALIFITHYLIDRYNLVKSWSDSKFGPLTPDYIKFFVGVVRDNTAHLLINYLILEYI